MAPRQSRRGRQAGCAPLLLALTLAAPLPSAAQQVRGVVLDSASGQPVDNALVTLLDSTAHMVAAARTNHAGRFALRGFGTAHYAIDARLIGFSPSTSGWIAAAESDTLDVTVRLSRLPVRLAAMLIEGEREDLINTVNLFGLNLRSLPSRNVITASQVEASRGAARDYVDLMQSQHVVGYRVWEYDTVRGRRCFASTRPPGGCLVVVVDDVRLDDQQALDIAPPALIEFAVIIPASEAGVLYGTAGHGGVLYIATRAGALSRPRSRR